MGVGGGVRVGLEEGEGKDWRESLGEWEGGDGGRADIGAGKKVPTVRDPF